MSEFKPAQLRPISPQIDNSIVHIRRSVYHHEETTPKTDAGFRNVDVHPDVMAMLKKHIGGRQSGRLFESRNGTPLVVGNVNRYVLKPILRKLGSLSERHMRSVMARYPGFKKRESTAI
jgi:hypothetical protein